MTDKNTPEYIKEYNKKYYTENIKMPDEPAWFKRKNKSLSDTTKNQYIKIIRRIHYIFSDKLNTDLEEVLNRIYSGDELSKREYTYIRTRLHYVNSKFIQKLEERYTNKTSLKVNLIPYTTLLSYLSEKKFFSDLHSDFSKYIVSLNKDYEIERDDNFINEEDKSKIITDFTTESIIDNFNKLNTNIEKVVYGIYTLIPPRRLEYLKVYSTTYTNKINDDKNYIVFKNKVPHSFIFQDYKTSKSYGRVDIQIPDELKRYIMDYVKEYKIKTKNLFIDMSPTKYIKLIKGVFNKVYGADISVRWIRMSYATYIDGLKISNNEKKHLALQMGHNLSMSSKYKKLL